MPKMVKMIWLGAVALFMAFLAACSADGPVQVITPDGDIYSTKEYNKLVKEGAIEENNDADEEETGEGGDEEDGGDGEESGGEDGDGDENDGDEESSDPEISSSSAKEGSSSSSKPASSSAAPGKETVVDEDEGEYSFGTDDMEEVSDDVKSVLDALKKKLDKDEDAEGFAKADLEYDEDSLPADAFDDSDYFCYTNGGEWLQITKDMLAEYIPRYKSGASYFNAKFGDACKAVYTRAK